MTNDLYYGIVENNKDPMKMGRCQVRIVGLHPKSRGELPIADLPWAIPIMSFDSNARGASYKPPVNGTTVVGYFQDSTTLQTFFMLGTIPINYEKIPNSSEGFSDPDGIYPKDTGPLTHKLARNEDIENTIVAEKKNNLITGELFDEPETTYNAEYPYNKVYEDEAGNIVEIDATPDAERIHVYHKSGSFVEFTNDGVVIKIKGDLYEFSNDKYIRVQGDCNVEVDGDTMLKTNDCNVEASGDTMLKTNNCNVEANGDTMLKTNNCNVEANGDTILRTNKFFVE